MALAQLQAAMSRLFTDAKLSYDFGRDAQATARRLGLDGEDAEVFAALNAANVRRFVTALTRKRILDTRKTPPLTARALGPQFDRLLAEEIGGAPPPGRHLDDATAFARRLAQAQSMELAWIGDLARYESAFPAFQRPGPGIAVRIFSFSLKRL